MTFEIRMTHTFDHPLTEEDRKQLKLSQVITDYITFICDDGNGERIFELPFYFSHSYINDNQQIEIVINEYSPEESDTDEFEWYWVPYIQEAYFGQIDYYHCTEKHRSDIGKKVHQYLTEKYGAHGADDHFTNCVIYNLETEEEHSFPDAYMN
jgi:hypothetical protein